MVMILVEQVIIINIQKWLIGPYVKDDNKIDYLNNESN